MRFFPTIHPQHILIESLCLFIAGAGLTLAFSPFNAWPVAILAMAYLFYRWHHSASAYKKSFYMGWLFGLGFFSTSVSWVYISLYRFAGLPLLLAAVLTLLFLSVLSLFPATAGYLLNRIFTPKLKLNYLMAFSCLYTLFESLRGHILSGFPWGFLAYSQINSPLSGFAPIGGELLVSFLVCLVSGSFAYIITSRRLKGNQINALIILLLLLGGSLLSSIRWTELKGSPLTMSLIQAAIPQSLKWDPKAFENNLITYHHMTTPHLESDLIIWPEAAITVTPQEIPDFLEGWQTMLSEKGHDLLLGIPTQSDNDNYYNSLMVLGKHTGQYDKRHLVPFGEYLFLPKISQFIIDFFTIPMSNFTAGSMNQPLIQIQHFFLATYICYEIAYESLVLSDFPQGNLLINISDDSWFGHSLAAWQQLQIGQFRALETGRWGVFSTNDGITAIVNQKGQIIQRLPRYQPSVLTHQVFFYQGSTPIITLGYNLWLAILLILFLGCVTLRKLSNG
jgi:apolipoprotein N-acyltransferase